MRLLGIDYGSRRVGIALSNEEGSMAFPHSVLPNDASLAELIESIIESENVGKVIVGHSLDREGKENPIHEDVSEFIGELTLRLGIAIELEPEQYTTQEAIRFQGRGSMTDASAAALILNSYIQKQRNRM